MDRLATASDRTLTMMAIHSSQDSVRELARRELERRTRRDLCPNGRGCTSFSCTKTHA